MKVYWSYTLMLLILFLGIGTRLSAVNAEPKPCPPENIKSPECRDPFASDERMSRKEASPTLKERITKDTVNGTLMKVEGEYYWIKDNDGKEVKIHVDKSTKMDKVDAGDTVKAYITEKGHTTTLQRAD
jgi:hypothetical protein